MSEKVVPIVVAFGVMIAAACSPGSDAAPTRFGDYTAAGAAGAVVVPPVSGAGGSGAGPAGASGLFTGTAGAAGHGQLGAAGAAGTRTAGVAGNSGIGGAAGFATGPTSGGAAGAVIPIAGSGGAAGAHNMAGSGGGSAGSSGGPCGSGTPTDGRPTTGPMACIVEQHNAVRAAVMTTTPLPPLTWSADLAAYAQAWTDMTCMTPMHRSMPELNGKPLGENLYASEGSDPMSPGKEAVDGWGGEVACYTYGKFMTADKCDMSCTDKMHSDGCGHYTQVVWRASTQVGCGVTMCGSGFSTQTEVICNYAPAGNFIGELPY